jgi:RimJ/RimL family protein N-acetyltransferase
VSVITEKQTDMQTWLAGKFKTSISTKTPCIGQLKDGKLTAVTAYTNILPNSCEAHIAVDGQISRGYLRSIFDYPFNQLKVRVILASVSKANVKSLNLCRKLGFEVKAEIPDAHKDGDLVIFALRKEQCRWFDI